MLQQEMAYNKGDHVLFDAVHPSPNAGDGPNSGQTAGRVSGEVKHPHLDKVLHPFSRSG